MPKRKRAASTPPLDEHEKSPSPSPSPSPLDERHKSQISPLKKITAVTEAVLPTLQHRTLVHHVIALQSLHKDLRNLLQSAQIPDNHLKIAEDSPFVATILVVTQQALESLPETVLTEQIAALKSAHIVMRDVLEANGHKVSQDALEANGLGPNAQIGSSDLAELKQILVLRDMVKNEAKLKWEVCGGALYGILIFECSYPPLHILQKAFNFRESEKHGKEGYMVQLESAVQYEGKEFRHDLSLFYFPTENRLRLEGILEPQERKT